MQQVPLKEIPAKCGNCGYLFPSGYSFDPGKTGVEATLTVQPTAPVSTPCPMCGRRNGRVLQGEYKFVKDTIRLLSGPNSTKEELQRFVKFLRVVQKRGVTAEDLLEKADKETPEFSPLCSS